MKFSFYKGETEGKNPTYRIVKELGNNVFCVVKLVKQGVYTVKFWKGDLGTTAKYWSTKKFTPSEDEAKQLVQGYKDVVNKMKRHFGRA